MIMIPLHYLATIFQRNEEDILRWVKQNKVTSSKIGNTWLIDEASFCRVLRLKMKLSQYDEYLAKEVQIREDEISDILLQLDDLVYLFRSIKKISPLLRILIREMASLITNELKRNVFVDVTSGMHISKVAKKYELTLEKACSIYDAALVCVTKKMGFICEYRNTIAIKELNIRRLEVENRNQKKEIDRLTNIVGQSIYEDTYFPEFFIPASAIKLLSLNLTYDLDLDIRIINCLRTLDIDTVEDLLRFVKEHGLNKLLAYRNFGRESLNNLKAKLIQSGVMDENENSYLFDYL